ncbi:MAG: glucose-6-phosphate isomerase [Elusimicrobiota bacterium]|nr:glucose-6-phosphate isomerase [Elusimicrobiota bacterium]
MLKLNYSNCLSEFIGSQHGISIEEIEQLKVKLVEAHKNLQTKKSDGKLGFMELPYKIDEAKKIKQFAEKHRRKFDNFVVVGIGGSALGNIALQQALNHPNWNLLPRKAPRGGARISRNGLKLFVADNVDPEYIAGMLDLVDLRKTLINVISKSGTTAEALANFFVIREKLVKVVGKNGLSQHLVFTTDRQKGYLRELANIGACFQTFEIPENVGGRFSVLSPVGLLSSAFTGIDVVKLLEGAREMSDRCSTEDIYSNPALMYAAIQYLMYQKNKKINVMMSYSNALYGIADWFRQLWAESLGKRVDNTGKTVNVGPTPIKALGVVDQHSQIQLYIEGPYDKVITFLSVEKFRETVRIAKTKDKHYLGGHTLNELFKSEEVATRLALTKQSRPNCTITLPEINEISIGELIFMLELSTAYMGELFNIDAYDQPGVELGKQLTYALLGRPGYEEKKAELEREMCGKIRNKYIV